MSFKTLERKRPDIQLIRKTRRYELCLGFITGVLSDFGVKTDHRHSEFLTMLGDIASCIDASLDELSVNQKDKLYWNFSSFFYKLLGTTSVEEFKILCQKYMYDLDINLSTDLNFQLLYDLVHDARALGIEKELNAFALQTIHAAIKKQHALHVIQIREAIQMEGQVAVDFLLLYLERKGLIYQPLKNHGLRNYLIGLERILNIADDIFDSKKDKRTGVIAIPVGFRYYFINSTYLLSQLVRTFLFQPVRFVKHCFQFTYRYLQLEMELVSLAK